MYTVMLLWTSFSVVSAKVWIELNALIKFVM